jgi:uncharacterized protein (DUF983 family)
MSETQSIQVSCPECGVEYRLWDEMLLPIARCGRCYGAVVPDDEDADALTLVTES